MAAEEAAARALVEADPRSSARKIRQRLIEARMENKMLAPLIAHNKAKTDREEYETGHTISAPLPVITGGELRMSIDPVDIYIDVLLTLADPSAGILPCDCSGTEEEKTHASAVYIFNLFTFFDRHWKQIVFDLRTGKLNKKLPVDENVRQFVESILVPAPDRSQILDGLLKELGFHRRASDAAFSMSFMDVDEHGKEKQKTKAELDREEHADLNIDGMGSLVLRQRSSLPPRPSSAAMKAKARVILHEGSEMASPLLSSSLTLSSSEYIPTSSATLLSAPPQSNLQSKESLMHRPDQSVGAGAAIDRPRSAEILPRIVRKLRPATIAEAFYDMATAPTSIPPQIIKEDTRSTLPFVCDHPGCGKVFGDPRSVKLHWQREHYEMPQIASKARRSDQLLRAFWPENVPWLHFSAEQIAEAKEKRKAGRPWVSKTTDGRRFTQEKELKAHLSFVKRYQAKLQPDQSHPFITFFGDKFQTPPQSAPVRAPLQMCRKHWPRAKRQCDECIRVSAVTQPRQPCTFYSRMKFIDEGGESTIFEAGSDNFVPLLPTTFHDHEEGTPCNVAAFVHDADGQMWASISPFLGYQQLQGLKYQCRSDFSRAYEVIQDLETHWIRLDKVLGKCYVIMCSREEFIRLKRKKQLPRGLCYFVRDTLNSMQKKAS